MDELLPPAIDGPDAKPIVVSHLSFRRDAGTAWARALSVSQIADLVDLAGELAVVFPILSDRRVTAKQFEKKLQQLGAWQGGQDKLIRIIGYTSGLVTLYYVWWSWAWVYNYSAACMSGEFENEEQAREATARHMGLELRALQERLTRRDVSYMVSLFLSRHSREMAGEVAFRTTQEALKGSAKAQELYYRHVLAEDDASKNGAFQDPFSMPTGELVAQIERMKKEVGFKAEESLPVPAEIRDASR